jgi:hypothetical protein
MGATGWAGQAGQTAPWHPPMQRAEAAIARSRRQPFLRRTVLEIGRQMGAQVAGVDAGAVDQGRLVPVQEHGAHLFS